MIVRHFEYFVGFGKFILIWYNTSAFRKLVNELSDIWPVTTSDSASAEIKRNSLHALRIMQICKCKYFMIFRIKYQRAILVVFPSIATAKSVAKRNDVRM